MRHRPGHRIATPLHLLLTGLVYAVLFVSIILVTRRLDEMRQVDVPDTAEAENAMEQAAYAAQTDDQIYLRRSDASLYLFAGVDEAFQVDFAMLLVVDDEQQTLQCLPVDPDTQVGAANAPPSRLLTVCAGAEDLAACRKRCTDAVSRLLRGTEPNGCFVLEMGAIPQLNDALGGVEIQVTEDWTGLDTALTPGATVRLNGMQADRFLRGKMTSDGMTNQARMERQRVYVMAASLALQNRLKKDMNALDELLDALGDRLDTSLPRSEIAAVAYRARDYVQLSDLQLPGSYVLLEDGDAAFVPDDAALEEQMLDLLYRLGTLPLQAAKDENEEAGDEGGLKAN